MKKKYKVYFCTQRDYNGLVFIVFPIAEFYFAISTREVDDFLRAQKVAFTAINTPCRSAAELSAAEAEHEAAMRAKIEADPRAPQFIHTIRDIGYRFDPGPGS